MKKLIEIDESEGLSRLMGETVTLLCANYFYTGKLVGVNDSCVLLKDPSIVYETGPWDKKGWADAQRLPTSEMYVSTGMIEAFGVLK